MQNKSEKKNTENIKDKIINENENKLCNIFNFV